MMCGAVVCSLIHPTSYVDSVLFSFLLMMSALKRYKPVHIVSVPILCCSFSCFALINTKPAKVK
jgi:hypothetical protein